MAAHTETALVPADVDARAAEVERQVAEARAQAEALKITDQATADQAAALLRQIAARRKAAETERKELKAPILEAGRGIDRKFSEAMAPFDAADEIVRGELGRYEAEQERIRREEEERLRREREERERKAREERERQEAEARAKREEAEREEREAAELAKAEAEEADREEAERLAAEARRKAEEAKTAEAAIQGLPDVKLPDAVVPAAPKSEGVTSQKRWEFEVADLGALPTHLPDGEALIEVRSGALRRYMHAYIKEHGVPPEIPGVEFKQVSSLAVRG